MNNFKLVERIVNKRIYGWSFLVDVY